MVMLRHGSRKRKLFLKPASVPLALLVGLVFTLTASTYQLFTIAFSADGSAGAGIVVRPSSTEAEDAESRAGAASVNRDHGRPKADVPWLIVGGGIHGVHIAARLLGEAAARPTDVLIVDGNAVLLRDWKSRAAATGMEYLRSSAGYHLDVDERSLRRRYGGRAGSAAFAGGGRPFAADYDRPRLDVFNDHCDYVVERYGLDRLHVRGTVTRIDPADGRVEVAVSPSADDEGDEIVYTAENVVLALGNDKPFYPDWVEEGDVDKGLVEHLFDRRRGADRDGDLADVAVIGGGISAAHKALELARARESAGRSVHLISRHPLREKQFDTHQEWMMDRAACERSERGGGSGTPKRQRRFRSTRSWEERRRIIARERVPGTVTPAINRGNRGLRYAIENGDVVWHEAEVLGKSDVVGGARLRLSLSSGGAVEAGRVFLATGFGGERPGGRLIGDLVETAGLEVSDRCGFPVCDEDLSWGAGIYVAGALAELELGPAARNIAGARLAAERIVRAAKSKR